MKKFKTTQAVSRLSIILAILVPLVFIGIVILKNQQIPAGFEIVKFGGIMLAIAIAVWLSVRLTAMLANILGEWLDGLLSKALIKDKKSNDDKDAKGLKGKVIDAEIVDEETSDGVWKNGNAQTKAEPDWAKATLDPHAALSNKEKAAQAKPKKRVLGPPSRTTKTIMVIIAFAVMFGLISNLFSDEWLTLLAPVPGLWAIISLWRIWDPKNSPDNKLNSQENNQ